MMIIIMIMITLQESWSALKQFKDPYWNLHGIKILFRGRGWEEKKGGGDRREGLACNNKNTAATRYWVTPSSDLWLWPDSLLRIQKHFLKKSLIRSKGCTSQSPLCSFKEISHRRLNNFSHVQNYPQNQKNTKELLKMNHKETRMV